MNDVEVALALTKIVMESSPDYVGSDRKEKVLELYRECLSSVREPASRQA